jgi:toxin ParE1/3/4
MARYYLSAAAEADVDNIGLWIARNSLDAAKKWVDDLEEKLEILSVTPGGGTDQSHLRKGMRSSPFGHYLLFYKKVRGGIRVLRIIHGARDYRRFF